MPDSFPNRSSELIVGPRTRAGLRVRRQVRCDHAPRQIGHIEPLPGAFGAGNYRRAMRIPVMLRMAFSAPA